MSCFMSWVVASILWIACLFNVSGNNFMPWFSYTFCYLVKHNIKASLYDHDGLISFDCPSFPVIFLLTFLFDGLKKLWPSPVLSLPPPVNFWQVALKVAKVYVCRMIRAKISVWHLKRNWKISQYLYLDVLREFDAQTMLLNFMVNCHKYNFIIPVIWNIMYESVCIFDRHESLIGHISSSIGAGLTD